MRKPTREDNGDPSPPYEKLLATANSASQTVAALHLGFIAFAAYLGVIVWGTSDEDLLRDTPVNLPILDVDLPLNHFYSITPWLLVLLHFNLLVQLELLSRKLWNLDRALPPTLIGDQIRDRLYSFPFSHYLAGRSGVRLVRAILSLVVGITVIVFPLVIILAAQIRFLPYHDEFITWVQRTAVWGDVIVLIGLWPLIASPNDQWLGWWKNIFRVIGYWCAAWSGGVKLTVQRCWSKICRREFKPRRFLQPRPKAKGKGMVILPITLFIAIVVSLIAAVPGNVTVHDYYCSQRGAHTNCPSPIPGDKVKEVYFANWVIRHSPVSWLKVSNIVNFNKTCALLEPGNKSPEYTGNSLMLSPFCIWPSLNNLSLKEAELVPAGLSKETISSATSDDKDQRTQALKKFSGLSLKKRDLRFADLSQAVLPKVDLRGALLQGADLFEAQLQGADLFEAQLQGADLSGAGLQGADLREAGLQGAVLSGAELQGADLREAGLQGADLREAGLQGAVLRGAELQGADLFEAQLQGANLSEAQLQGADLREAGLQGAKLIEAQLQGADLREAGLQGADLREAQLQGAVLRGAELQGAILDKTGIEGIQNPGKAAVFSDSNKKADMFGTTDRDSTPEEAWADLEAIAKDIPDDARREVYKARIKQAKDHPTFDAEKAWIANNSPKFVQYVLDEICAPIDKDQSSRLAAAQGILKNYNNSENPVLTHTLCALPACKDLRDGIVGLDCPTATK